MIRRASQFSLFLFTALAMSACIGPNNTTGLAGNDLYRISCPLEDSDEQCGSRARKVCQAKGMSTVAGLTFGQETRFVQTNCTVIGGARICSPNTAAVKTATFICTI